MCDTENAYVKRRECMSKNEFYTREILTKT